jgi:glycosyltransferase involved in cell wall biosynthesis
MTKINVMSPINELGYGIAGYNVCKALHELGSEITLFPIGEPQLTEQSQATLVQSLVNTQREFDSSAPCLKIWHEFSMAERIGRGPLYAYPFFEINKFDDARKNHLKSCDGIFVASDWANEIVCRELDGYSPENVHTVPLAVNSMMFSSSSTPKGDKCVFYNCGKWEVRKGHDILLGLFQKAFPSEEDVELWMMCENPFLSPEETSRWKSYYSQDWRVKLLDRVASQENVAAIMSHATCGVFPSRAEGWNLELLEMMALGKPVIATNYSAHTEFCNEDNCMLIEPSGTEKAEDGKWFHGEAEWASLKGTEDQFVEHLRSVYKKWRDSDESLFNQAGVDKAKELSWKNTGTKILGVLNE